MSYTIANYTFLPWLRHGLANKINSPDHAADVKLRANIDVKLNLKTEAVNGGNSNQPINKKIQLYGPGDILGIDKRAIIKTDPLNWITNYEPNYLPYIEFYDEDFPWRYTPAAPSNQDRLRPWLALVILKEGDFEEATNIQGRPLSYITVKSAATKFPNAEELWAWAHVQINQSMMDGEKQIVETDKDKISNKVATFLKNNPDLASSRILCPMKLDANCAYHAFLIPTFETGRLAGLGLEMPSELPNATFSAWDAAGYTNKPEPENFPVYHRWYFRTGEVGDFEYLVRLLKPGPVDKRVGRKDIDVLNPGSNVSGITKPELGGILRLGGALKVPFSTMSDEDQEDTKKYEDWDLIGYPQTFQKDLASFINLADDYNAKIAKDANDNSGLADVSGNPDPLITAPLYGRWHALTERLLTKRDGSTASNPQNWVHQLNLDPRWRVTAAYGTTIIKENQEKYMEAAWQQVGDVLAANNKIRLLLFAKFISKSWYNNQIQPLVNLALQKNLMLYAPLHSKILLNGTNIRHQVSNSVVTRSMLSPSMRKILRPGGRTLKLSKFTPGLSADNLIERINEGEIKIVEPKVVPESLPTVNELVNEVKDKIEAQPSFFPNLLKKYPYLNWVLVLLFLLLIILIFIFGLSTFLVLAIVIVAALFYFINRTIAYPIPEVKSEAEQSPGSVNELPISPNFELGTLQDPKLPTIGGNTDSVEAAKFKEALKEDFKIIELSRILGEVKPRPKLNIGQIAEVAFAETNPIKTFPKYIQNVLFIPDHIRELQIEFFTSVMYYPKIDVPMYEPLKEKSSEYFLPNINYIGQNTISLLETNQKFIESYMVGLNHEFSRELLWREYPTDQRGSTFRQFWDVKSFFNGDNLDDKALKEKLRDIPPLHIWSKSSKLGLHDHRQENGKEQKEEVVLVIRGDLLKKYPNAVIYAQKAKWIIDNNGNLNNKVERELVEIPVAQANNPPKNLFKTPLYEARVDPDIFFFGFDLTVDEALGGTGATNADLNNAGWFFCIKERPGESRFGFDTKKVESSPEIWNDMSWDDVTPANSIGGTFVSIGAGIQTQNLNNNPLDSGSDGEKVEQRDDDIQVQWNSNMNAADVAYIAYQVPVLMAVHAGEMLPKQN